MTNRNAALIGTLASVLTVFAIAGAASASAQLVVNEFDYTQPGPDNAEFIELYAVAPIELGDYTLQLINGTTGVAYRTIALPAVTLAPNDYFVVCGSTSVIVLCDLEITPAVDFMRNDVPSAVALVGPAGIVDTISYGGDSVAPYTELIGTEADDDTEAGLGLARVEDGFDFDFNSFDVRLLCTTPGAANQNTPQPCDGIYEIAEIQGASVASPVAGQTVRTERNIVTAVQNYSSAEGFYMQTPVNRQDGDPRTSEGIFVFTDSPPFVQEGDEVNVVGTVTDGEHTYITNFPLVQIVSRNNGLPPATLFTGSMPSPLQPVADNELLRFEGMIVDIVGVTASPSGTLLYAVPTMQRPFLEAGIEFPGEIGIEVFDGNAEVRAVRLNGTTFNDAEYFAGQVLTLRGNLGGRFTTDIFPIRIDPGPEPALPRAVRAPQDDEVVLATQHLGRLFDTIDNPDTDDGVVSQETYDRRLQKLSYHVRETLGGPDIIAVQNVESQTVLQALADRIAADDGGVVYAALVLETATPLSLNVGFLLREDAVEVLSVATIGQMGSGPFSQLPLAIDVMIERNGVALPLTLINVQLPFGSEPSAPTEFNLNVRRDQAVALATHIDQLQAMNPDQNLVVLGDFGAPQFSNGYVDVLGQISGDPDPANAVAAYESIIAEPLTNLTNTLPEPERYSAIDAGNALTYDHIVISDSLLARVSETVFSRGNADAPAVAAGNVEADIGLRVASRDGAVLYLVADPVDSDGDGVADSSDNCVMLVNPDQRDTNGDGFGNRCDPDLNNDGIVNVTDLGLLRLAFFGSPGTSNWSPDADFNGDDVVNVLDLGVLRSFFFGPPG